MNAPPPEPIRSLDARYYTDPAIFAAELTGHFAKTWHFAGHGSQLQEAGDYFSFELFGESLFCIKGRDGVIRTFYNVCQHRAHQLVSGEGATRVIVCPYHAWTYELTGALRAGPNLKAVKGFDKKSVRLREVRTELFLGFIFVNLDPDAAPMETWFPNAQAELESFVPHWRDLKPLEWIDIQEQCNWKVSVENYSECYHCTLNHPSFSAGVIDPQSYDIQPQGYCLRHTTECNALDQMTYDINSGFENNTKYSSWFLWPMFSFQVYPGNLLNTYHWRPVDAENVVVWRGWYSVGGMDNETVRRMAQQDRATTVEEDILLVESVQRGLRSRGYTPGPLVVDPKCGVNSEHSIMHLQRWMREAVDG
ncbi:MAG: aromatic ring-hydroxylating dioxygenase subunit alpha [Pseudomonadota bacterium]